MLALIAARAVQGLGAGGLLTLAFTIVGDIFSFEERARFQGLFSGVWGVSSVIGPLLGGFLVDKVSWHWIFFINIVPGLLAAMLVWGNWADPQRSAVADRPAVDYAGAALLTIGVVALLLGLLDLTSPVNWMLLGLATACLVALVWVERRAADPVLPVVLFRDRMFAVACVHGVLAGCALFGSTAYIPLFVQAVLGTSATVAGASLTPLLLAWVFTSIIGSRLLLRLSYRTIALIGMVLLVMGTLALTWINVQTNQLVLMTYLALMGAGMGLSIPSFLIAVQSTVERYSLGSATSALQFSRTIGGTLGVSMMGTMLSFQFASRLRAEGLDPARVPLNDLLAPEAAAGAFTAIEGALRVALAGAIQSVFIIAFAAAVLGLAATALAPRGSIAQMAARRADGGTGSLPAQTPGSPPH